MSIISLTKSIARRILHPPQSEEAVAAIKNSIEIVKASQRFVEHQDALADMVRSMKGKPRSAPKSKRTRKK